MGLWEEFLDEVSLYRKHYEAVVNTVTLNVHPSIYYVVSGGALNNIMVRGHMIGHCDHITGQVLSCM